MIPYNKKLIPFAQELRKHMTEPEKKVWQKLRFLQLKGYQFYRQKPVGDNIVDCCSQKGHLIIELGGDSHYSDRSLSNDERRDCFLSDVGFKVRRFTNTEVMQEIDAVIENIGPNRYDNPPFANMI